MVTWSTDNLPPIGLSVYETYGKSESEQTLVGGDTGLESGCDVVDLDSSWVDEARRSVTAMVFPRCKRVAPAPVAVLGRPWMLRDEVLPDGCDCSEPICVRLVHYFRLKWMDAFGFYFGLFRFVSVGFIAPISFVVNLFHFYFVFFLNQLNLLLPVDCLAYFYSNEKWNVIRMNARANKTS